MFDKKNPVSAQKINFRRLGWVIWFLLVAIWIYVTFMPLSSDKTRLAFLITSGVVFFGLVILSWRMRFIRYALIAFLLVGIGFAVLPGKSAVDVDTTRAAVARSLKRYENVHYYWGGESFKGIDCSGLIRRGFIDGCFLEGLRTFNPWLVRKSVYVWWHDCTAKSLGEEYMQFTRRIFARAKSINDLDASKLKPGDIAVTSNGVHVLAYLGNGVWIEADPAEEKVVQVKMPSDNPWLRTPVQIVRWRVLDSPEDSN